MTVHSIDMFADIWDDEAWPVSLVSSLLARIDVERILFSVDYPYEQMDVAGRWFDDPVLDHEAKAKMGRGTPPRCSR